MPLEPKDRIILALDVSDTNTAFSLIAKLGPYVGLFKVGIELIHAGLNVAVEQAAIAAGSRFFRDSKLHDIPNSVAGASRNITRAGAAIFNVMCQGGHEMMMAAVLATKETHQNEELPGDRPILLGVTLLTAPTGKHYRNWVYIP